MLHLPFVSPTRLALQPMWLLQWNLSIIALTCALDQALLKDSFASIALGFNGQTPIALNPFNMFCLDKDWSSVLLTQVISVTLFGSRWLLLTMLLFIYLLKANLNGLK
jgi:hypothetical protein